MKYFILLFTLSLIVSSCKKEDFSEICANSSNLGITELKEESKELIPYKKGQALVFKNVFQDSLVFVVRKVERLESLDGMTGNCEFDQTIGVSYSFKEEYLIATLDNFEQNISFEVLVYANMMHPSIGVNDLLVIRLYSPDEIIPLEVFDMNITKDKPPVNINGIPGLLEEWNIGGATFKNVYKSILHFEGLKYETLFNKEFGFIGYRTSGNPMWYFDKLI